jgi:hypothetical protein
MTYDFVRFSGCILAEYKRSFMKLDLFRSVLLPSPSGKMDPRIDENTAILLLERYSLKDIGNELASE